MAEMNGFMNMTQIRKLTQQILKPIVQQIEIEISNMRKQSEFLKEQSSKTAKLFESQQKIEQHLSSNKEDIRNIKLKLEELTDEDIKNMLKTKKDIAAVQDELELMKRERAKYQEMIKKLKIENQKTLHNFNKYQQWMDKKAEAMNDQYIQLKEETLGMTVMVKSKYEETATKYAELQKNVEKHLSVNDKKYEILELYLAERETVKVKLIQLEEGMKKYAPIEQIEYLRCCQLKELEMNKQQIDNILDTYLPPSIKKMLPQIEERVNKIDRIKSEVEEIKSNVFESEQQIQLYKDTTQSLQSNFRKEVKDVNEKITENIEVIRQNVEIALKMDEKQTRERQLFEKTFEERIHKHINNENTLLYSRVQKETQQRIEVQQVEDTGKIQKQQELFNKQCQEMKDLSEDMERLLGSYNSRITKVRSDTELFKDEILKELRVINKMKSEYKEKFEDVGKVFATLIEINTILSAISLQESQADSFSHSGSRYTQPEGYDAFQKTTINTVFNGNGSQSPNANGENFSASTYNDGLIFQSHPYNSSVKNNSRNLIIYRRKNLQTSHLKRCILTSNTALIDKIFENYPYLDWKGGYRPSTFFKEEILENYNTQIEKYGSSFAIGAKISGKKSPSKYYGSDEESLAVHNQNIVSSVIHFKKGKQYSKIQAQQQSNQTRNKQNTSEHHNDSPCLHRYSTLVQNREQELSFREGPQKTTDNNSTILNNLGETIDENIEIVVNTSHEKKFQVSENDKMNIKRTMRIIHEVHPKDCNGNRFILSGLANRKSVSKDNVNGISATIDYQPQSAGGSRKKKYTESKSKNDFTGNRYNTHINDKSEGFMTSRSTKKTFIANQKI